MRLSLLLCAGSLAVTLTGCGSGAGIPTAATGSGTIGANTSTGDRHAGSAVLTIHWPRTTKNVTKNVTKNASSRASRLIPAATQSLKVTLSSGAATIATKIVTPPASGSTSSVAFDGLTAGALHVTATAYSTPDATGTALASGALDVTITSGQVTSAALSLTSTIDHMTVAYTAQDLLAGEAQNVTVTAYDAAGNVILLTPGALIWTSSDSTKAIVAATATGGAITGVSAGPVNITVTDSESHASATFPVQGMTFSITPTAPTVPVGGTQTFQAAVAGLSDTMVTYSLVDANGAPLESGGANGSIDAQGHYTAPSMGGTCYVRATSVGDPARFVTATLTIQAGNAAITVQ